MEPCRFDYVLEAIEALRKYVDTTPEGSNTRGLLAIASTAISHLDAIEEGMESRFKEIDNPRPKFSSALKELNLIFKKDFPKAKQLLDMMDEHKSVFDEIKNIAGALKNIESVAIRLSKLKRGMSIDDDEQLE